MTSIAETLKDRRQHFEVRKKQAIECFRREVLETREGEFYQRLGHLEALAMQIKEAEKMLEVYDAIEVVLKKEGK